MSRGYWYTLIAVVGWLIASPALSQQAEQQQPQSQGEGTAEQRKPAQFSVPVRILENPEQSEADKRSQQEATKREIEDLAAQQGMAKGTQDIVWLSKLQLALAFAGTLALLYSIALNRRATKAAVQGNANTIKAIAQEQTNAERQLRAYIGFEKTRVDKIDFAKPTKLLLTIKNFGQTPAYDIKYSLQLEITRIEGFAEIPKKPPKYEDLIGVFNPGHTLTLSPVFFLDLSAEDFGGELAAKFKIFIYMDFSFVDAFKEKRTCEMNMFWMPMKDADLEINYSDANAT